MVLPLLDTPLLLPCYAYFGFNERPAGIQGFKVTAATSGGNNIAPSSSQAVVCATSPSSNIGVGSIRTATTAGDSTISETGGHSRGSRAGDREHTSSIRAGDGTSSGVDDTIVGSSGDGNYYGTRAVRCGSGRIAGVGEHSSGGDDGGGGADWGEGGDDSGGESSGGVGDGRGGSGGGVAAPAVPSTGGVNMCSFEEEEEDNSRLFPDAGEPSALWRGHTGPVARIGSCSQPPCFFSLGEVRAWKTA